MTSHLPNELHGSSERVTCTCISLRHRSTAAWACKRIRETQPVADPGAEIGAAASRARRQAACRRIRLVRRRRPEVNKCAGLDVRARLEQSLPGALRRLRLHGQPVERAAVDLDLLGLLQ